MEFGMVPVDQLRALRDVVPAMKRISDRTDQLLDLLIKVCQDYRNLREAKIEIERISTGVVLANIKTPFRNGRIVLSWEVVGQALHGIFLVERECRDQYEKQYWETVWGLNIPEYDNPFTSATADGFKIPLDDYFGDSLPGVLATVVLCMVYGIVNGSVTMKV